MNRYLLHNPKAPIKWVDVKPGQIWGWKDDPTNTGFFIKIDFATVTGWMVTGGIDIPDQEIKENYILLHENDDAQRAALRMMLEAGRLKQ